MGGPEEPVHPFIRLRRYSPAVVAYSTLSLSGTSRRAGRAAPRLRIGSRAVAAVEGAAGRRSGSVPSRCCTAARRDARSRSDAGACEAAFLFGSPSAESVVAAEGFYRCDREGNFHALPVPPDRRTRKRPGAACVSSRPLAGWGAGVALAWRGVGGRQLRGRQRRGRLRRLRRGRADLSGFGRFGETGQTG